MLASAASLCGVPVPWTLTKSISAGARPASARAASTARGGERRHYRALVRNDDQGSAYERRQHDTREAVGVREGDGTYVPVLRGETHGGRELRLVGDQRRRRDDDPARQPGGAGGQLDRADRLREVAHHRAEPGDEGPVLSPARPGLGERETAGDIEALEDPLQGVRRHRYVAQHRHQAAAAQGQVPDQESRTIRGDQADHGVTRVGVKQRHDQRRDGNSRPDPLAACIKQAREGGARDEHEDARECHPVAEEPHRPILQGVVAKQAVLHDAIERGA